ncbi:MAG: hypothetical protein V4489_08815 [Chlamydiota bacterium]
MQISGFLSRIPSPSSNQMRTVAIVSALAAIVSIGLLAYNTSKTTLTSPPAQKMQFTPDNKDRIEHASPIEVSEIQRLSNTDFLTDEDCLSSETLSEEKAILTSKIESHSDLVDYIKRTKGWERREALCALFTILGVKPATIFEGKLEKTELYSILLKKYNLHEFKFKNSRNDRSFCLANESPLEIFNPKRFLEPLQNTRLTLAKATIDCFIQQGQEETDQMLSYLLGFGPSYEAYQENAFRKFDSGKSIFSDAHYEELGGVFSKTDLKEIGFHVHEEKAKLAQSRFDNKVKWIQKTNNSTIEKILCKTGTAHIYDGISARTEYSKKNLSLKKWVLENYFPEI